MHSFDRPYVVTIFILPSIQDLKFSKLKYDNTCAYLDEENSCDTETYKYTLDLHAFCKRFGPYVSYYKRQIKSYNNTSHNILKNEIDLVLLQLPTKQKCGIIIKLVSSFIGLIYKGISSFLHNKRYKILHKAVKGMDSKTAIQCNKLMQLENSMVMCGIYNAETLNNS